MGACNAGSCAAAHLPCWAAHVPCPLRHTSSHGSPAGYQLPVAGGLEPAATAQWPWEDFVSQQGSPRPSPRSAARAARPTSSAGEARTTVRRGGRAVAAAAAPRARPVPTGRASRAVKAEPKDEPEEEAAGGPVKQEAGAPMAAPKPRGRRRPVLTRTRRAAPAAEQVSDEEARVKEEPVAAEVKLEPPPPKQQQQQQQPRAAAPALVVAPAPAAPAPAVPAPPVRALAGMGFRVLDCVNCRPTVLEVAATTSAPQARHPTSTVLGRVPFPCRAASCSTLCLATWVWHRLLRLPQHLLPLPRRLLPPTCLQRQRRLPPHPCHLLLQRLLAAAMEARLLRGGRLVSHA